MVLTWALGELDVILNYNLNRTLKFRLLCPQEQFLYNLILNIS